eukprot:TRINITY_DN352_c2_g1_i1.p1 TRINITY_DN352_c2_g1~~TRINITY_DN352_c2_g1_i1.p1  ORF type:complete len:304 (+),score=103.03 TRINITY_DN352_c2_g1_i1:40-951(+)
MIINTKLLKINKLKDFSYFYKINFSTTTNIFLNNNSLFLNNFKISNNFNSKPTTQFLKLNCFFTTKINNSFLEQFARKQNKGGKSKGGKKNRNEDEDEDEDDENENDNNDEERENKKIQPAFKSGYDTETLKKMFDYSIEQFRSQLSSLQVGRANPELIEKIIVTTSGGQVPIGQIAFVSLKDASSMLITLKDIKLHKVTVDAIEKSDLKLQVLTDGNNISVLLPKLTKELRISLSKQAAKYAEQAKISIRRIRKDAQDAIKASKKTVDEVKKLDKEIQNGVDQEIKKIEQMLKLKEQDIMKQ